MPRLKSSDYKIYSKFIANLATKLTSYYYSKLNKPFKVSNKLRGNGYGVFKYVNKYTFDVKSSTVFTAQEGEDCQVRVIVQERAGIGHSFFERPQVKFEPRCRQMSDVVE